MSPKSPRHLVLTDSTGSAVELSIAYGQGGKCDNQGFINATLDRQ